VVGGVPSSFMRPQMEKQGSRRVRGLPKWGARGSPSVQERSKTGKRHKKKKRCVTRVLGGRKIPRKIKKAAELHQKTEAKPQTGPAFRRAKPGSQRDEQWGVSQNWKKGKEKGRLTRTVQEKNFQGQYSNPRKPAYEKKIAGGQQNSTVWKRRGIHSKPTSRARLQKRPRKRAKKGPKKNQQGDVAMVSPFGVKGKWGPTDKIWYPPQTKKHGG